MSWNSGKKMKWKSSSSFFFGSFNKVRNRNFTTKFFHKRVFLPFYISLTLYLDNKIPSKIFHASIGICCCLLVHYILLTVALFSVFVSCHILYCPCYRCCFFKNGFLFFLVWCLLFIQVLITNICVWWPIAIMLIFIHKS